MRRHISYLAVIAVACFVAACGPKLPQIRVWRPWLRSLEADNVGAAARLQTVVQGLTEPLLGDEDLIHQSLKENLDRLLQRRGFQIVGDNPDYEVRLTYAVKREDKLEIATNSYASSALGIAVARKVGVLAYRSAGATAVSVGEEAAYVHTFSVEFFSSGGRAIWKGEATWDSRELDVLSSISSPLQLALSGLPSDPLYVPLVPAVKVTHGFNYYTENCLHKWLTCPALPYSIAFPSISSRDYKKKWTPNGIKKEFLIPNDVKNPEALEAYVDLISTAEYALPTGIKKWNDPTDVNLWKKAKLGGRYRLGADGQVVNVIIELSGSADGYTVGKAYIATDAQYGTFETDLLRWKQALKDYYDFYEK